MMRCISVVRVLKHHYIFTCDIFGLNPARPAILTNEGERAAV